MNKKISSTKESYTRVKESKQQSKQFITYDLDSNARVNDSTFLDKKSKKLKSTAKARTSVREVSCSCLTWVLYHYATELRHLNEVKLQNYLVTIFIKLTVVYTIATVFFTLVFPLSFSLSQHCCHIR